MNEFDFDIAEIIVERFPSARFMGGGGAPSEPPQPQLTAMGKYAEKNIWGAIKPALNQEGLLPRGLQRTMRQDYMGAMHDARKVGRGILGSQMNRMIPGADKDVRKYLIQANKAAFYRTKDDYRRGQRLQNYQDYEQGQTMAVDQLAAAKKMGTSITGMYNQQLAQNLRGEQAYGNFSSNIAEGLGGMGGWLSAAQQYGKTNSGTG